MGEKGCSISEAAKRSGVEAYVLRYWEEEGLLIVPRNAKGHRCYTEAEFAAISSIQKMKKEGLSLKDIRDVKLHPEHREKAHRKTGLYCRKGTYDGGREKTAVLCDP